MALRLAAELGSKTPTERKQFDFEFGAGGYDFATGEAITSIDGITVSPSGGANLQAVEQSFSGSTVQVGFTGGKPDRVCTCAASTGVFTKCSHGFVDGDRVRLEELPEADLPWGLTSAWEYFVVSAAASTFRLAYEAGGTPIDFATDGRARVMVEYEVVVRAITSTLQELELAGRIQVKA